MQLIDGYDLDLGLWADQLSIFLGWDSLDRHQPSQLAHSECQGNLKR